MSKVTLRLNLPSELNAATQRTVEGTEIVVTRDEGYVGDVTKEELAAIKADPYIAIVGDKAEGDDEGGEEDQPPVKPLTKKELLAQAEAEGLVLEGITEKSKVAEITAAIEAARNANTEEDEEESDDEGDDEGGEEDQE